METKYRVLKETFVLGEEKTCGEPGCCQWYEPYEVSVPVGSVAVYDDNNLVIEFENGEYGRPYNWIEDCVKNGCLEEM